MPVLHLHGPPAVTRDDGRRVALAAREAALLAWLHLAGPTARARLAGRLWPAGGEAKARANLRQTLLRLKRDAGDLLAESDGVLALAPATRVAEPGTGPGQERLLGPHEFDDAPELAEWLQARREAGTRERRRLALAAAQARLAAGRSGEALALAEALLAEDDTREEAHRIRMQALLQRGDRAAAVAAWDDCRLALRAAFGIAPSETTNELGRRILAVEAAPPGSGATSSSPTGPAGPDTLPPALLHPPARAGQDAAWATLQRALDERRPLVLHGAAGSGKSRLLAEALAGRAALVVTARPGDPVLPGALVARLVAALLATWQPQLDRRTQGALQLLLPRTPAADGVAPRGAVSAVLNATARAADHQRALQAVQQLLQACAARGLQVLAVDDLQFADTLSLDVLSLLVAAGSGPHEPAPVLPLLACRVEPLRAEVQAVLDLQAGRPGAVSLTLPALDEAAVLALLQALPLHQAGVAPPALPALAQALRRQLGGNPAQLLEALRTLWHDGLRHWQPGQPLHTPPSLVDSVRQRLTRLSAEALQLAQLAAVAQGDFSLGLAAAALGRAPLALAPLFAELDAAQVLQGLRFGHDLVAEAVLQALPVPLHTELHRLVADLLAAQQAAPARVAAHLVAAGEQARALPWQMQAGAEARDRWRLAEAQASFTAALDALAVQDPALARRDALRAGHHAARCALWRSRPDEAQALLARVAPLAQGAAERVLCGTIGVTLAINTRRVDAAVSGARALADDLLAAMPQLPPGDIHAALRALTAALPMGHEDALALRTLDAAQAHLAAAAPGELAAVEAARGSLLLRVDREQDAVPALQRALAPTGPGAAPSPALPHVALGGDLMRALQTLGRADEALAAGEAALAAALDGGFGAGFEFDLRGQIAVLLLALGRPQAAAAQQQAAEAAFARSGRNPDDVMLRATVHVMAGRLVPARQLLANGATLPSGTVPVLPRWQLRTQARLAEAAGQDSRPWHAQLLALPHPSLADTLAAAMAGPTPALDPVQAWLAASRAAGWRPRERVALVLAARAALQAGQVQQAAEWAQASLALADAVDPWLDDTARRWCDAADVLLAVGTPEATAAAQAALAAGRRWVQAGLVRGLPADAAQAWRTGSVWHRRLLGLAPVTAAARA